QRRADRPESREQTVGGKMGLKKPAEYKRYQQKANQQREGLVRNIVFSIGREQCRHDCRTYNSQSGRREAPPRPIANGGCGAVDAIDEEPEESHRKKVRSSKFEVRNKSETQNSKELSCGKCLWVELETGFLGARPSPGAARYAFRDSVKYSW